MEKLSLKDKKIIYELDFNARMSLTQLGKKVGLSKQAVKYRLENLQRRGIIQGYYADVNASKAGFSIYLVYLKFHQIPSEKEMELIKHVGKQKYIGVNVTIQGKWDYCIGVLAESIIHFKNYYNKIMSDYEKYVKNKTIMIVTDFYYFKPKQILEKDDNEQITMTGELMRPDFDEKDKEILALLAKDARISLVDMSKKIGLTANAIKGRIKNLEKNGIIGAYRVMINYPQLGFLHYRVFLHLDFLTEEKENKIISFLKNQKPVISVTKTIGYCDLEFRAIVKDIYEFYTLIEDLRKQFPDMIKDYESILYYKFYQNLNYFPFD